MRRIHIERRKVRRGRPWLEVLALDPRDPDVVRAKTGRCGEQQPAVTGNDARAQGGTPPAQPLAGPPVGQEPGTQWPVPTRSRSRTLIAGRAPCSLLEPAR